ncbi:MAG: type II toxin-antitoxin system RelE/ParE family toxin [Gammaproteobacteria bacterium]
MDERWIVLLYADERGREHVREWLEMLERTAPKEYGVVTHQIDLLEEFGPILSEPHTKQLRGKLRELRAGRWRVTYFMDPLRQIVLLTSFSKVGQRTPVREVARAERAMKDWMGRHKRRSH